MFAVAASAQTTERHALWQKYFGGKHAAANVNANVNAESLPADEATQRDEMATQGAITPKGRLEGTWVTNVSFDDGFVLKVLFTFMAGKDDTEGTLIDTNEFLLTPDPIGAPDQGVWQRTSEREFIATHLAFLFNSKDGSPAGTARVRDYFNINQLNTEFRGRQFVEIYDTDGNFVISFSATMTGVKMQAQAPPAP
jgi:hypothetical protein